MDKKGYKLLKGSTTNTVSRSTYQQPPEQSNIYKSSFEHNIPQSHGLRRKRSRYHSKGVIYMKIYQNDENKGK